MSDEQGTYMLAQCGVYEKPMEVTRALRDLAQHFPVVAPGGTTECHVIPEGYGVSVTAVLPTEQDVYKDSGSGQTCFKAAFLKKLAAGLGIEWIPSETRRLDNFQHPFVCSIIVAGRYRDWSGELRTITGTHMLDLRDEAAHGMTPKQLPMARKNIAQLCETKAKSRAIADACISRTIDPRDLNRPIPMAKLYRRDPIDPAAARAALYGPPTDEPIRTQAEIVDHDTGEVRPSSEQVQGNHGAGPSSAPNAPAGSPPRESVASSGRAGTPPAAASPAPTEAPKPYVIPKGCAGAGKTFFEATTEELEAYRDNLSGRLGKGEIPKPGVEAAERKLNACIDAIESRKATELNPW